ncbi:homoaconitase mitochondrial precursor [Hyaloraphidium curvatum]|nr:homoaconitase mitochondrial precursor [Hyaloraphidium curvatum]
MRGRFPLPRPSAARHGRRGLATAASQNLVEKIVQRYAVGLAPGARVKQGDFVSIRPENVMTHDNTGAVMKKFKDIGAAKMFNPRQPVFTLDHDVQNKTEQNLKKYKSIEAFAKSHGVDFYPAGRGIGHQVMVEEGYAFPGTLTVASDSHSNMYGGIASLGTPIVRTDAAAIWATGRTWWQLPPVALVELTGRLPPGATGKDVIVTLCGVFNKDEVLNHAIEFVGEGAASLSVDERLTVANMTTEWGALAGVFPFDGVLADWYFARAERMKGHPRLTPGRIEEAWKGRLEPDAGARYAKHLTLDLSTVSPYLSGPNSVKVASPLAELEKKDIKIQKAYLVSCVNSRASDLRAAAAIFAGGKKVHPDVEFYVAAASSEVQADVASTGEWQALLDAGARPLPAGCGPCIGLGTGLLKDGEVGISATNRNFKGRMGSPLAQAYLASPAVVAASAIAGRIAGPASLEGKSVPVKYGIVDDGAAEPEAAAAPPAEEEPVPGFEPVISGEILFCDTDNLNTDGIYPGKYTYQDDFPYEQMGKVVMENYDTEFVAKMKPSDILISGTNFGTGSSREQAATAFLSAGLRLVIAGSFSETYKRNAINNGLLVLETTGILRDLRAAFPPGEKTRRTGWNATIDLVKGTMDVQTPAGAKSYALPRVGRAAQELLVDGGLENWVKKRIASE